MCTLVWGINRTGWWLCFNRDEQRSRARAEPPATHEIDGVKVLAPLDPDGGGTWFAVNEHGLALVLLNRYREASPVSRTGAQRSRGLLVLDLSAARSVREVEAGLEKTDFTPYAPFHLYALRQGEGIHASWDPGGGLRIFPPETFLTTSSYRPSEVAAARGRLWKEQTGEGNVRPDRAAAILRTRNSVRPALGLCMDREDARTVSQLQVHLNGDEARVSYRERAASAFSPPLETTLLLIASA
ncbi:MAG: hypothetical protein GVY10_12525 [Verrucomicrobia bacterium]|jgi:hypothetical protein|nr:hypothetical protein [Verrucomicrobiota bacterium]